MLAHQWHSNSGVPVVFLHGLLGSQQDWQPIIQRLQHFPKIRPLTLDLPCHGASQALPCRHFEQARYFLHQTLTTLIAEPFYLVGYSLGGRLALDYLHHQPNRWLRGLLLEGANIGLTSETERQARWQADLQWAARFRQQPLETVLAAWYQQPVFADLPDDKRADFIKKRQNNNGERIAEMLTATSLAKQPFFPCQTRTPLRFLIGERDQKFRQQANAHQLPHRLIANAGHNAHQQSPDAFTQALLQFMAHTEQIDF